jgi:hypothetical protein
MEIIPDGVAQVGCTTLAVIGTTGVKWNRIITTDDEGVTHSIIRCFYIQQLFGANPEKYSKIDNTVVPIQTVIYSPIVSWMEILPDGVAHITQHAFAVIEQLRKWNRMVITDDEGVTHVLSAVSYIQSIIIEPILKSIED